MKHRFIGAVIAALCLTAPAQAQSNLHFVLYYLGSTSPAGLVATPLDRPACDEKAAAQTAAFAASKEPFRVRCEVRGPGDMVWKLHPWLAVK